MKLPLQHFEIVPLERLIRCKHNPRTHSPAQIAGLARCIAKMKIISPLLVDSNWVIIAGHARADALQELNVTDVPVMVIDHLSEAEKRAYMIADNKLALDAGWDEEKLQAILSELDGDLRQAVGFDERQFEELRAKLAAEFNRTDEDAAPEIATVPVSRLGDLWTLDHHCLLCADSTSMAAIEQVMAGEAAAMAFTDPPYNVDYQQKTPAGPRKISNDNLGDDFEPFLYEACANILRVTNGAVYMCMASAELHSLYSAFTRAGGHWSTFLIWSKDRFTLGRSDYHHQFEAILYGWKRGGQHFWAGGRKQGNVWPVQRPRVNDLHPTMKPIQLIERAILNSSRYGDLVLDPFAGAGSTLIACQKTGRQARLIELEPTYVDVIIQRWQEFSGRLAKLEGRSFAEVAAERLRKAA